MSAAVVACSSSKDNEGEVRDAAASGSLIDAGVKRDASAGPKRIDGGGLGSISVGADSPACTANLGFHPPGCGCSDKDDVATCFSGRPTDRNRGRCHEGKQECKLQGEFRAWQACEGEETDCGDDAGTPEECECVPGTKILCSEDCQQLIICSLTGTKTCQPDGTWGPCTEQFLAGLEGVVGCKNLYYKCLVSDSEGIYVGDCDQTFTCGHPPGLFGPPAQTPDAGAGDAGKSTIIQ